MIHFTCDICGKRIAEEQRRYRVTIEVESRDPCEEECDEEEFFEEDSETYEEDERDYHQFRFDLCEDCAASYIANPLPVSIHRFRINDN
ncbi:MAG: hypothetical protein N2234_11070 [Planctomycetota bacterium]|nr:hypothetical protein [Planctomycetota bacterium]